MSKTFIYLNNTPWLEVDENSPIIEVIQYEETLRRNRESKQILALLTKHKPIKQYKSKDILSNSRIVK